jgi:Uma2 family endonuclease
MGLPAEKFYLSALEYLAIERAAETKSEYFDGEMFAMAGASPKHSLITANVTGEMWRRLKGKPCVPYSSDLRIHIPQTGLYTYPDLSVVCGPLDLSDDQKDTLLNPSVIVEVLSDSTEKYDRGAKFSNYRAIPSLRTYVLISQNQPLVEVYHRQPEASQSSWQVTYFETLDAIAYLESIDTHLPLADVYYAVDFTPKEDPLPDSPEA